MKCSEFSRTTSVKDGLKDKNWRHLQGLLRPQAQGKLISLMSPREEQGSGLIIAHVAEEFKGGDYGEK